MSEWSVLPARTIKVLVFFKAIAKFKSDFLWDKGQKSDNSALGDGIIQLNSLLNWTVLYPNSSVCLSAVFNRHGEAILVARLMDSE